MAAFCTRIKTCFDASQSELWRCGTGSCYGGKKQRTWDHSLYSEFCPSRVCSVLMFRPNRVRLWSAKSLRWCRIWVTSGPLLASESSGLFTGNEDRFPFCSFLGLSHHYESTWVHACCSSCRMDWVMQLESEWPHLAQVAYRISPSLARTFALGINVPTVFSKANMRTNVKSCASKGSSTWIDLFVRLGPVSTCPSMHNPSLSGLEGFVRQSLAVSNALRLGWFPANKNGGCFYGAFRNSALFTQRG